MGELWELLVSSRWGTLKRWQKALILILVAPTFVGSALFMVNQAIELGHTVGMVHSQDNTVHVDLSGNIISNTTHFVDDETLNGTGKTLILAHIPNPTNSLLLFRNGQRLRMGSGNDYTLSANKITLLFDRDPDEQFDVSYRY